MTAKEKAKELIDYYRSILIDCIDDPATSRDLSKECALICVEEIKNELINNGMDDDIDWWDKVEQEISDR